MLRRLAGDARLERILLALSQLRLAPRVFPAPMYDSYFGLMEARCLMAAVSTGVIRELAAGARTADQVAAAAQLDTQGTAQLLLALQACGYVESEGVDRFTLTRRARHFLAPDAAAPLHAWVGGFTYDMWEHFGSLDAVLAGASAVGLHDRPADDPYWQRYMRALHELSSQLGPSVARTIPMRRPRKLLDLAGGHAGFAMAMCRRHPDLSATIAELPGAARVGREIVESSGFADRVSYREGDLFKATFEADHDVVTAHAILHNLSVDQCVQLIGIARDALRRGGVLAALELEQPAPGRTGTRAATFAGLLFWLLSHTRTYTADEIATWFTEAGLRDVRVHRPMRLLGQVLVTGKR